MDKSASLLEEATKQMNDGKFSRAFTLLKDLLAKDPTHHEGRRLLATLLLKFGNLVTAKNAFDSLLKEAFQLRDYDMAESLLREYLTVGPRCVAFVEMLGEVHERKGDPIAAVIEYEKAIKILLDDPEHEGESRAKALYIKVKSLAPGSFVIDRLAPKFERAIVPAHEPAGMAPIPIRPPMDTPELHAPLSVLISDVKSDAKDLPARGTIAAADSSVLVTDGDIIGTSASSTADLPPRDLDATAMFASSLQDASVSTPIPSIEKVSESPVTTKGPHDVALAVSQTDSSSAQTPAVLSSPPPLRFTAATEAKPLRMASDSETLLNDRDAEKVPFPPINQMPLSIPAQQERKIDMPGNAVLGESAKPDEQSQPPFWERPEESCAMPVVSCDRVEEPTPVSAEIEPMPFRIEESMPASFQAAESAPPVEVCEETIEEAISAQPSPFEEIPPEPNPAEVDSQTASSSSRGSPTEEPSATTFFSRRPRRSRLSMMTRLRVHVSLVMRRCITTTGFVTRLILSLTASVIILALLGVGVTAVAWLGFEENPTDLYQELVKITAPRVLNDPQINGYVLLLGFEANPQVNPLQEGHDRRLSPGTQINPSCLRPDEAKAKQPLSSLLQSGDPASQLKNEDSLLRERMALESVFVNRYRQWLGMSFDDWGYAFLGSPDCEHILRVHQLFIAEGFSQDLAKGLDRVETDLAAWREVLAHAKTLSMKVLATEAIKDNVAVMSGLLNRPMLDNRAQQRMARLAKPLDADERSLRWPMHNEFLLEVQRMESRLRTNPDMDAAATMAIKKMPVPKQRTLNAYAKYYDALMKTPLTHGSIPPKLYDFVHSPARNRADSFMNPFDNLLRAEPMVDWERQMSELMDLDARLRLAGLQARLRGTAKEQQILAKVAQAGPTFFDPFTELPMLLNVPQSRVYSVGRDGKDDGGDSTFDISVPIVIKPQ